MERAGVVRAFREYTMAAPRSLDGLYLNQAQHSCVAAPIWPLLARFLRRSPAGAGARAARGLQAQLPPAPELVARQADPRDFLRRPRRQGSFYYTVFEVRPSRPSRRHTSRSSRRVSTPRKCRRVPITGSSRAVPQMQGVQGTNRGEEVNNRIFSRKMCGGSNCNGSFVKQFVDGDRVLRASTPITPLPLLLLSAPPGLLRSPGARPPL